MIPERFPIERIEDYHTHYIGKCRDNRQFMIYEPSVFHNPHKIPLGKIPRDERMKLKREYVVIYIFDIQGNHLITEYLFAGTADIDNSSKINEWIHDKLDGLGNVKFDDIKVKPFQSLIDGYIFGLVADHENGVVELQPGNTISFSEPWDGQYNT